MRENVNISNNSNGLSWSQSEAGSKWEVTSMWLSVANTLRYYHHFLEFHPTGPSHPRLGLITHTHNPDLALRSSCGGGRTMSLTTSASLNATGNEITLDCGVTFSCSSSKIQDRELRRLGFILVTLVQTFSLDTCGQRQLVLAVDKKVFYLAKLQC